MVPPPAEDPADVVPPDGADAVTPSTSPRSPRVTAKTSAPTSSAVRTTARTAEFMPCASPPLVSTARRIVAPRPSIASFGPAQGRAVGPDDLEYQPKDFFLWRASVPLPSSSRSTRTSLQRLLIWAVLLLTRSMRTPRQITADVDTARDRLAQLHEVVVQVVDP